MDLYLHLVIHSAYFLDRGLDKQSISISAILNYEILETTTQYLKVWAVVDSTDQATCNTCAADWQGRILELIFFCI